MELKENYHIFLENINCLMKLLLTEGYQYTRLKESNNEFPVKNIKINIDSETGRISVYNDL